MKLEKVLFFFNLNLKLFKIFSLFKKLDMCKRLNKLLSQFLLLLQSFSKLLPNLNANLANITVSFNLVYRIRDNFKNFYKTRLQISQVN